MHLLVIFINKEKDRGAKYKVQRGRALVFRKGCWYLKMGLWLGASLVTLLLLNCLFKITFACLELIFFSVNNNRWRAFLCNLKMPLYIIKFHIVKNLLTNSSNKISSNWFYRILKKKDNSKSLSKRKIKKVQTNKYKQCGSLDDVTRQSSMSDILPFEYMQPKWVFFLVCSRFGLTDL